MGKWNFDYNERIKSLEAENKSLKAQYEGVIKHVERLTGKIDKLESEKAALSKKAIQPEKKSFARHIDNLEKVENLFGVVATYRGEIEITDDSYERCNNFQTFVKNLMRAIKPKAVKGEKKTNGEQRYNLRGTTAHELTDEEFTICCDAINDIVDICYAAKEKISEAGING